MDVPANVRHAVEPEFQKPSRRGILNGIVNALVVEIVGTAEELQSVFRVLRCRAEVVEIATTSEEGLGQIGETTSHADCSGREHGPTSSGRAGLPATLNSQDRDIRHGSA